MHVARVQERGQPLRAVRLGGDHAAGQRRRREPEPRERAGRAPLAISTAAAASPTAIAEPRSLDHDQAAEHGGGGAHRAHGLAPVARRLPASRERGGAEHAERDLGQLGGLQREAAGQAQPALRAVALDAGREHEHEQQRGDHEHARRERGDVPVVVPGQQPERREADRGVDRVVLEQRRARPRPSRP